MMSKKLVNRILSSRQEVTTGSDGALYGWTETELRLAEYAAELQTENARLAAELAAARELLQPMADAYEMPRVDISDFINSWHTQKAYQFLYPAGKVAE